MNVGQLYEIQLSTSLEDLKKEINKMIDDSKINDDIKTYLIHYIKELDSEDNWYSEFLQQLPEIVDKPFIDLIQPPDESVTEDLEGLKKGIDLMLMYSKINNDIKTYLINYIKIIDNTKDGWYLKQFIQQLPEIVVNKTFINNLSLIQPPFESVSPSKIIEASNYTNTDFEHKVYDPISKIDIENKIAVGFIYFFRMVHIAENRLAARGIGSYAKRTLQPLGGRKFKGGQRCGEMETGCLAAYDATENLFEFLTVKSDCIDLKRKYIEGIVNYDMISDSKEVDIIPESVKLLNSYLTVCGLEMEDE